MEYINNLFKEVLKEANNLNLPVSKKSKMILLLIKEQKAVLGAARR